MDYATRLVLRGPGIEDGDFTEQAKTGFTVAVAVCLVSGYGGLGWRITTHLRRRTWFRSDDWLATISLVFMTAFAGTGIEMLRQGASRRIPQYIQVILASETDLMARTDIEQSFLAAEILYIVSLLLVKLSFFVLYRRHLGSNSRKLVCLGFGWFNALYSVTSIIVILLQCSPHSDWLAGKDTKQCLNTQALVISIGVFDAISLLAVILLPRTFILEHRQSASRAIKVTAAIACFLVFGYA